VEHLKSDPQNRSPSGKDFEDLFFELIRNFPETITFNLENGNNINLGNRRCKVREFGQKNPLVLNRDVDAETLVLHKPIDRNFPDVDFLLEFEKNDQKYLFFLQMTISSPQVHTTKDSPLFFTNEERHFRALDHQWRMGTKNEKKRRISELAQQNPLDEHSCHFVWCLPKSMENKATYSPRIGKLCKFGQTQIIFTSEKIHKSFKKFQN